MIAERSCLTELGKFAEASNVQVCPKILSDIPFNDHVQKYLQSFQYHGELLKFAEDDVYKSVFTFCCFA